MDRIALIADIHGNAVALERVLDMIEQMGIERIICLGDVAATGPQPKQVVAELRRRNIPTVMGNADAEVLDPPDPDRADEPMKQILEMSVWGSRQLDPDDRAFLTGLPAHIGVPTGTATDHDLLCVHGSPRSYNEHISASTPDAELGEILADHDEPLIAFGHTHIQLLRRHGRQTLINPGSVGLAYDVAPPSQDIRCAPWAEFAIIEYGDGRLAYHFERVPYDVEPVLAAARESGMPHAEWWTGMWRSA